MDSPELVILDVGHGNCSVLIDTKGTIIVDCADCSILTEFLELRKISQIEHVLVSHADRDHIEGVTSLLFDKTIKIRNIYVNPDPSKKNTVTWADFRLAIADAMSRGTQVLTSLTSSLTGSLDVGEVKVEVLAPSPVQALGGVGGKEFSDSNNHQRQLTSNSLSAVIGLLHNSHRAAILAGDLEQIGLDDLLANNTDIRASILVFPHHGGRPGSTEPKTFAQKICNHVSPKLVIFSNARGGSGNPREDIVQGVRLAALDTHIVCTQLSKKCADTTDSLNFSHLSGLPSEGAHASKCCGGSLSISLNGVETFKPDNLVQHKNFVDTLITSPLCRKSFSV
ncbi:ComEC/Rec2 family competence protein [Tumidithrix elongata]